MLHIPTVVFLVAFGVVLLTNLFIRVLVLQNYKILVKERIDFGKEHMNNIKKLRAEILPKYPKYRKNILVFVRGIQISKYCNFALVTIVSLFVLSQMLN